MATKKSHPTNSAERFHQKHPTKSEKTKALKTMTRSQINNLIRTSGNQKDRDFYSAFRKSGK